VVLEPVLLAAPPTREIVDASTICGVDRVKFADVVVPAGSAEIAA
jgi:hypothetical protein